MSERNQPELRMKIVAIIKKEFAQIVKKKSFLVSTILTPILMAAMIFIPMLLTRVGREIKTIEISDHSGLVSAELIKANDAPKVKETLKLKFVAIPPLDTQNTLIGKYEETGNAGMDTPRSNADDLFGRSVLPDIPAERTQKTSKNNDRPESASKLDLIPEYKARLLAKQVDGLLVIPESLKTDRRIYFFALNISDFALIQYLSSTVQKILSRQILTDEGYNIEVVEEAIRDVTLGTFKVKKEGITKSTSGMDYMMSIFMLTILFMVIMLYGQLIMRGIIEEKNDRIIEVLISSTNTHTLFFGKIIGVGLAGLTQILIWIVLAVLAMSQFPQMLSPSLLGFLTPELGLYFIIFFIIGYFMYSILFAIVGAAVNTDQEAQQYAGPIFTIMFIPFLIGIMVTQNPNTLVVLVTSLFPLFSPTLMFMRISVAVPPFSQIAISIILSILTTLFLAWLGAKIFRTGILMYGKKPSIKEILKWARYK